MDLEMTGLDPARHVIVEIATVITDDELELIAEGPDLVVQASPEELAEMDDFVAAMHARSGLTEQIEASSISIAEACQATLGFLRGHISEARSVPLAGNSIWNDRRFLAEQMPEIDAFLHYRCVDVSSIKELARRWRPSVLEAAPSKGGSHRALDDIMESIEELRHYRATFFRQDDA
jgi:oligoribonuclease